MTPGAALDSLAKSYRLTQRLAWHYTTQEKSLAIVRSGYIEPRAEHGDTVDLVWFTRDRFWELSIRPHLHRWRPRATDSAHLKLIKLEAAADAAAKDGGWVRFGYPAIRLQPPNAIFANFDSWQPPPEAEARDAKRAPNIPGWRQFRKDWLVSPRLIAIKDVVAVDHMDARLEWTRV